MRRQGGNVNEKFSGKKRSQQRGGPCSGFHFYGNVKGKVSEKKVSKKRSGPHHNGLSSGVHLHGKLKEKVSQKKWSGVLQHNIWILVPALKLIYVFFGW